MLWRPKPSILPPPCCHLGPAHFVPLLLPLFIFLCNYLFIFLSVEDLTGSLAVPQECACPGHQKSRRFWRTATLLAPYLLRTLPITHFSCCPFLNTGSSAFFHPPYHWLDKGDHPTFSRRTLKDPPLAGPFAQGKCLQGQEEYLPGPHDHPSHSRHLDTKSSRSNVPEPFLDLVPRAIFLRQLCSPRAHLRSEVWLLLEVWTEPGQVGREHSHSCV